MTAPHLPLRHHATLLPLRAGVSIVAAGVAPDGAAAVLWAGDREADLLGAGRPPFITRDHGVLSRLVEPVAVQVTFLDPAGRPSGGCELSIPFAHPFIQPFGDGFAVVAARAWATGGGEANAAIYDRSGRLLVEGCVGDGIADVAADSLGRLWLSFFDEGVFGNLGWGFAGAAPLGAAGVVAYDASLRRVFEHDQSLAPIADCYAMNVAGDRVLVCPYEQFPLVTIVDGVEQVRRLPAGAAGGPWGVLVAGGRVGLLGTYESRDMLTVIDPDGRVARGSVVWPAVVGDGEGRRLVACRSAVLHAFEHGSWWQAELPAAV